MNLLRALTSEAVVPASLGRYDDRLGWALVGRTEATSAALGLPVTYRINSQCIRSDREFSVDKPQGLRRIILIGDSETFGWGVPVEQHFSTLLEGYLGDVEVINLGVQGYGIDQMLLSLQYKGLGFQPDVVIAHACHYHSQRHMHTERWGKVKPRFELVDGLLTLTNSPVKEIAKKDRRFESQEEQDAANAKNMEDPEFRAAVSQLGLAILQEIGRVANENGAWFLLVTKMPEHEALAADGVEVLNVRAAMDNKRLKLPNEHINGAGNGVLAWEIASYIQAKGLLDAAPAASEELRASVRVNGDH